MTLRVAVPDLVSNSYFPAIAAVELGFFKAEGLDATVELIFPVPQTMAALKDGTIDFAAGAAHAPLTAFPGWRGAKLLMALARRTYWFLVVRSDLQVDRGQVEAVKGLRIGAAPGVDLALHRLLADAGIDEARDGVRIGPIPGASAAGVSFGVTAARALENGELDGFWANGMGAEVAVRKGVGTVVLDVRRGDGPPAAGRYTFPALVATERKLADEPEAVRAGVRAVTRAQRVLRDDPERALQVGRRLFPPLEAEIIPQLIRRDAPFYDPVITREMVADLNRFARDVDLLTESVPYERVVANILNEL